MNRYSTVTGDLFDGVELDTPRYVPAAGGNYDAFGSQPRAPATPDEPTAPATPASFQLDAPLGCFHGELPAELLAELARVPCVLVSGSVRWTAPLDETGECFLTAHRYAERWLITYEGTISPTGATGGYGGSCMSTARVERYARTIIAHHQPSLF